MKTILLFLCLLLPVYGLNEDRLLAAIAMKEGGHKTGHAGELGIYQMMPATVKDAGGYDKAAALRHLKWLEHQLWTNYMDVNVFNLALCWNAGFTNVRKAKSKVESYRYAVDVLSLYEGLGSDHHVRKLFHVHSGLPAK